MAYARESPDMPEVLVCKEGELANGAVRIVTAGDIEIGVIRDGDRYFAYRNVCPHQGGPVCEGVRMPRVVDKIDDAGVFLGQTFDQETQHIVCPWHGYEFKLTTGENVCDSALRLQKFDVLERDGNVYVAT